ncbi:G/T mismatch-specific thymine DNA glycosylase isoform X1 [Gambusia affinis]|uniref:G/T mismatch-specific thymine DNA glycosylase isoform X1 n=1 Tax=Gambusia affinis TaxID=33528 RepID=UPI001CDD1694|nr:G/T mismatch-specific thymine DNA glycosylase isoform X1 [Gambusia affinis]
MYGNKSTVNMEEKQFTALTVPTDYFQQWYQANQQHPEAQHMMPYHGLGHYTDGYMEEPVMAELSVHREPSENQEPFYHSYPPASGHYQEQIGQPSFSEHLQQPQHSQHPQQTEHQHMIQQREPDLQPHAPPPAVTPVKKKRGRPAKQQVADKEVKEEMDEAEAAKKAKRILNRFNGMSVAEVMAKTLPDVLTYNLDILIIGINPGLLSAYKGRHYPNPGNHFWKCLFLSGLTEQQLNYMHDQSLPEKYSIGFTNMVERTTPGSKDLSSKEIREGGRQLLEKLQKYKPLIAAFNGKGIYEIFCKEIFGVKGKNLEFGLQPYKVPDTETVCFLMPSSSPRCAQFPRAQDKVHFYIKLKELRDQMKGLTPNGEVLETRYSFDLQLAKEDAKRMAIKEEQVDPEYESCSGLHDGVRQSS